MEKNSFWNKNCFGNASCQHASCQDPQSLAVGTFDKIFYHMFQKVGANNTVANYLFKMCSRLTIKTPEQPQQRRSSTFIVNFEIIHTLL